MSERSKRARTTDAATDGQATRAAVVVPAAQATPRAAVPVEQPQLQESPTWPSHESMFPDHSSQRVQPRFSSEPPLLDLGGSSSFFESPALMPTNGAFSFPTMDMMPGQMDM